VALRQDREKDLRDMALRARMERAGALDGLDAPDADADGDGMGGGGGDGHYVPLPGGYPPSEGGAGQGREHDDGEVDSDEEEGGGGGHEHESAEERVARQQREQMRVQVPFLASSHRTSPASLPSRRPLHTCLRFQLSAAERARARAAVGEHEGQHAQAKGGPRRRPRRV